MYRRPNLFSYGISELTQDAMLSWLFDWAGPQYAAEDPALHKLGRNFLALVLQQGGGHALPLHLRQVSVARQVHRIDILVEADDFTVLVEDKVGSTEHSDQLNRYLACLVDQGRPRDRIVPVYIQTHEQADYTAVEGAGYRVIHRTELLQLLDSYRAAGGRNGIVTEIHGYLADLQTRYTAFWHLPAAEWTEEAWQGFFTTLQKTFTDGSWLKVNNASEPFWAFHWGERGNDEVTCYMQIEEESLAFKTSVDGKERRSEWRNHWHERIVEAAEALQVDVHRPQRFGHGQCMTFAFWTPDYRKFTPAGQLDFQETIAEMRRAVALLDRVLPD